MSQDRISDITNQINDLENAGHQYRDQDADGYPTPEAQKLSDLYMEYDQLNGQLWEQGGPQEEEPQQQFGARFDVSNAKPLEQFTWEENNKLNGFLDQLDSLQGQESDALAQIDPNESATDLIQLGKSQSLQSIIENMARVEGEIVKMTGPERFNEALSKHPGLSRRMAQDEWFNRQVKGGFTPEGEPIHTVNPQGAQELKNLVNVPEPATEPTPMPGLTQQIFDAMREGRPYIRLGRSTYFIHEHPTGIELTQQQTPPEGTAKRPGITFPEIFPEGTNKP